MRDDQKRALLADGGKGEAVALWAAFAPEGNLLAHSEIRQGLSDIFNWEPLYRAAPQAECAPREAQPVLPIWWSDFITNICDIPGRTSPEGEPEAIIATIDELRHCALASIEAIEDAPASDTAEAAALRAFDKSKIDGYSHDLESYCAGYIDAAPTPERAQESAGVQDAIEDVAKYFEDCGDPYGAKMIRKYAFNKFASNKEPQP